jgi:cyclopropane fatty-acyl-phospholipid synthase-like methyltransferase
MVTLPASERYFARATPYLRHRFRIQARSELVRELIDEPRGKRILDLGCGNGAISLPWSHQNEIVLVDSSAAMLEAARANARHFNPRNCRFIEADVNDLDMDPFDIVLAIGLLAHVCSTEETMAVISQHLVVGGRAVVQLSPSERFLNRFVFLLLRIRGRTYRGMTTHDVVEASARSGLYCTKERSHLAVLPGIQRLVGRALVPLDRFVRRRPTLARCGSETILVLQKSPESEGS